MSDKLVLDLETKKSFDEVGGQHNSHLLEVSLVGVYSYELDQYRAFREEEFKELASWLKQASLIIGFNIKSFDYAVLQPYYKFKLAKLPTLDILEEVYYTLGRRLKLDTLAQVTLGEGKSGSGLDALVYYRNKDWQTLEKYCLDDVRLTKNLYEYGLHHGHLWYENNGKLEKIKVRWGQEETIEKILQKALTSGQQAEIVYQKEGGEKKSRQIDIRYIKNNKVHAFCHLRKDIRIFEIEKIHNIKIQGQMVNWQKKLF